MVGLRIAIGITWGAFWLIWLMAALGAKHGTRPTRSPRSLALRIGMIVILIAARPLSVHHALDIGNWPVVIIGTAMFVAGLGVALWARASIAKNWGMPMTLKDEPELVDGGPYRFVRHPIY